MRGILALLLAVVALLTHASFGRAAPAGGTLAQVAHPAGCISDTGNEGLCENGISLNEPFGIAVTPDGANAYSVSGTSDSVVAFARKVTSGTLTQLTAPDACISEDGTGGSCAGGHGLDLAYGVTVSPDGKNVYVASLGSDSVTTFARDTSTGALKQLAGSSGCISASGNDGCGTGRGLNGATTVVVSPDGKNVYVAADGGSPAVDGSVAVFARDTTTGALTQLSGSAGCISETGNGGDCSDNHALDGATSVTMSGDGKSVYVVSLFSDAVAIFSRDTTTGALTQLAGQAGCVSNTGSGGDCAVGRGLDYPHAVTISPDDKFVYTSAVNSDAIAVFARDASTGQLSQLSGTDGCVSNGGSGGTCRSAHSLSGPIALVLKPDGRRLYAASYFSHAIDAFARDPGTGALTQLAGTDGCVSEAGGDCAKGVVLENVSALAAAPDGPNLYAASPTDNAVSAFSLAPWSPPVCTDATRSVAYDKTAVIPLACSDPDGDPLQLSIVSDPAHGSLGPIDQVAGTVVYTPSGGYSGSDAISFHAHDADGSSNNAKVSIDVGSGPPNTNPLQPPTHEEPPSASEVLGQAMAGLPVGRSCSKNAKLKFRLRQPKRAIIDGARAWINSRLIAIRNNPSVTRQITFSRLPRGRFTLHVRLSLHDGRKLEGKRAYPGCRPPKRRR